MSGTPRARILGIDPGIQGAFALVGNGTLVVRDMPTIEVRGKRRPSAHGVATLIAGFGPVDLVVVEDVQGVQGSGATSAFSFGRGAGVIEGVLAALERPTRYVTPQAWTKDLGVARDKGAHREMACRLFPEESELFARVKDDGRADAALLAHWGWRWGG